ncbi:phage Gp37/Gp68 family protein [Burkholderia contaminans]|uniref:Phage Gp37/Gp68 family protein n=1 Tax=Burkholderia contaminans TaxID=488447 RepID=A0A2S5DMD3_9BURK|nr:phage Gp37/Gp68 family protein [Burkholderia contaminans]POZ80248.1 phage Gp37/Gp68 family protein [Burkholderia contaminans]
MEEGSKIEWTDHTFNGWIGCTKVSPACDHCYAEVSTPSRTLKVIWGPHAERHRTSESTWQLPRRWNARHEAFLAEHGRRQRVFCASLADWADNEVPVEWLANLLEVIRTTPNLDWLMLTKRIGNVMKRLRAVLEYITGKADEALSALQAWIDRWFAGEPPMNVWLGATIVSQPEAERDIPKLLETPARVRFLSMEPLLGPVDLGLIDIDGHRDIYPVHGSAGCEDNDRNPSADLPKIDWVIVGGESGPQARPMHPQWVRDIRDQCAAAGTTFLFKQWGEWKPICQMDETRELYRSNRVAKEGEDQGVLDELHGRTCKVDQLCLRIDGEHAPIGSPNAFLAGTSPMQAFKIGKKVAGRLLDGRAHDEFPVEVVA